MFSRSINEKVLSAHDMHYYTWYGTQASNEMTIRIPGLNDPNVAWFWTRVKAKNHLLPLNNRLESGMFIDSRELDVKMIDYKCQPITKLAIRYGWYIGPSCQGHFPDYNSLKAQWETIMQVRVDLCKKRSTIMKNAASYISHEDSYAMKRPTIPVKAFGVAHGKGAKRTKYTYKRYYDSYHEYANDVISLNGIGSAFFGFGPQHFEYYNPKALEQRDMDKYGLSDYARILGQKSQWSKMLDRNLVEVVIDMHEYTVQFKITSSTKEENDEAWTLALLEMKKIHRWLKIGEYEHRKS